MYISIIVPAFNEDGRLKKTIDEIIKFLNSNYPSSEIIIVDDGSADKTLEAARKLAVCYSMISVVHYSLNKGKGYAIKKGVEKAKGKFIFYIDADGSTPIEELPKFINFLEQGIDIVIGSRHMPESLIEVKQPFYRRALGRAANVIIQILLLPGIKDSQCGFKGFRRQAAIKLFSMQTINRWGFDFEILALALKLKYKIQEVPVRWINSSGSRVRPLRGAFNTLGELAKVKYKFFVNKYTNGLDNSED